MSNINNRLPVRMEFTIGSITDGIEYWLTNVVLKENIVVDDIIWDSKLNVFSVKLARSIQVGQKL